jgi:hypothetical protein
MNRVLHSLVGYDRLSEKVAEEFDVPDAVLPRARELARVPADDPEAVMCYALDAAAARDLADRLRARVDPERCEYFLEGFIDEIVEADRSVAQLVEHRSPKPGVGGSSPSTPAMRR